MLAKTVGEVVAEVKLLRAQDKDLSLLIVEGGDDRKFWTHRVVDKSRVVVSGCKSIGKSAIYKLNVDGFSGCVGVFDADYDDFQVGSNVRKNILFWDAHSIECVLFFSAACDRVLHERIGIERLASLERRLGRPLRLHIANLASEVGRYRALHAFSGEDGEKGAFSPFKFVARQSGLTLDSSALIKEAVRMKAVPSDVQAVRAVAKLPDVDDRYYSRGHDITAIMSIAIGDVAGTVSAADVEQSMRLAFDASDFQGTSIWRELKAWEGINPPFCVVH